MRRFLLLLIHVILIASTVIAQTGKISGTITDQSTGEPLIGVNVILEGYTLGAATDIDGYYTILNVAPGTYTLRASMIGYSPKTIVSVRVNIDQTTMIDVELSQESIETSEIVVVAQTPIVQRDVSASGVNLNAREIQNLPVVSVQNVVNLQAGVDGGAIRGGAGDEIVYQVNGITMRDGRDNTPYNILSFTSVDQIKVQTGGFTAEMGDARSGVVEVVTKEGSKDHYTVSFYSQISPYHKKYFGPSVNDPDSYFLRPFLDEDVSWTGVNNGAWDEYTRRQYVGFQGWNTISQQTLQNDDPSDDLTPEAARDLFLWQHRKKMNIEKPDYDIDMTVGGPVPIIGRDLGNLRFISSYKSNRTMLLVPLSTEDYYDFDASLKLTSDVASGMKLMVEGHYGQQSGTSTSTIGAPGIFRGDSYLADRVDYGNYTDAVLFSNAYFTPTTVTRYSFAGKFTHVINQNTFYQVILNSFSSDYDTQPGDARDTSRVYLFGDSYYVDESPLGYYQGSVDFVNAGGMQMGSIYSQGRDKSKVTTYNLKFDITSQLDKYNNVKAGIDFRYTDNNTHYMLRSLQYSTNNRDYKWHTFPIQAAVYLQDKLEFEEMVANIGVRLDYSDPNTTWYDYTSYDRGFSSASSSTRDQVLAKTQLPRKLTLSPRLGVAFPISVDSKLFFNYGHFQALPVPENLYQIRFATDGKLEYIANPEANFERTIQYELGYEHNLFNQFLLRVTGYYKDISNESRTIQYISSDNTVSYSTTEPIQYRDIRGFEFQLSKNRGEWVTGFLNYTYMLGTTGKFGWGRYYESKVAMDNYIRTDGEEWYKQSKPKARPYARINLDFFTPDEFGPEISGVSLLGDIRLNLLTEWKSGSYYSWVGRTGLSAEKQNNLQWRDYFNMDMRLTKGFRFGDFDIQFFVQIYNLFNIKRLSSTGFSDSIDEQNYYESLHLSSKVNYKDYGYTNVPGDDQPGDYRAPGAEFTPIQAVQSIYDDVASPTEDLIYFDAATNDYYEYADGNWQTVDDSRMNKILDDKSYIDMPNFGFFTFLNKREIFYGVKINISL